MNREKRAATDAAWQRANRDRHAASIGKARVVREYGPERIPVDFDFEATVLLYAKAQELTRLTGVKHEVDHIIPLCYDGLHEASNLQVLTRAENQAKRKRDRQLLLAET